MDNRVETAMKRWDRRESGYVSQFGDALLEDRDFNKVRLQVWKRIERQLKSLSLSDEEGDDLALLRARIKQLTKAVYPGVIRRRLYYLSNFLKKIFKAAPVYGQSLVNAKTEKRKPEKPEYKKEDTYRQNNSYRQQTNQNKAVVNVTDDSLQTKPSVGLQPVVSEQEIDFSKVDLSQPINIGKLPLKHVNKAREIKGKVNGYTPRI